MTDRQRSRACHVDIPGLQVTKADRTTICLRAIEERGHHCTVLQPTKVATARYLGFTVRDEDNLDRAAAFFAAKGLPEEWLESPHITRAFAFFPQVRDPDGHRIKIQCSDCQTVDPDHEPVCWDLKNPQRQTLWGAPAPRSWFEAGSLFTGIAPVPATLTASPITAP